MKGKLNEIIERERGLADEIEREQHLSLRRLDEAGEKEEKDKRKREREIEEEMKEFLGAEKKRLNEEKEKKEKRIQKKAEKILSGEALQEKMVERIMKVLLNSS